jgi:hypothetical protein
MSNKTRSIRDLTRGLNSTHHLKFCASEEKIAFFEESSGGVGRKRSEYFIRCKPREGFDQFEEVFGHPSPVSIPKIMHLMCGLLFSASLYCLRFVASAAWSAVPALA